MKQHLQNHGISYRDHQKLAFFFAKNSLKVSLMSFVHGIFPIFFQTNASDLHKSILPKYNKLFEDMKNK